jgi:hypothetical protein
MLSIKKAIIIGDVKTYEMLIFENRQRFLKKHTFAIFEKLTILCERNLIVRVCSKLQSTYGEETYSRILYLQS